MKLSPSWKGDSAELIYLHEPKWRQTFACTVVYRPDNLSMHCMYFGRSFNKHHQVSAGIDRYTCTFTPNSAVHYLLCKVACLCTESNYSFLPYNRVSQITNNTGCIQRRIPCVSYLNKGKVIAGSTREFYLTEAT